MAARPVHGSPQAEDRRQALVDAPQLLGPRRPTWSPRRRTTTRAVEEATAGCRRQLAVSCLSPGVAARSAHRLHSQPVRQGAQPPNWPPPTGPCDDGRRQPCRGKTSTSLGQEVDGVHGRHLVKGAALASGRVKFGTSLVLASQHAELGFEPGQLRRQQGARRPDGIPPRQDRRAPSRASPPTATPRWSTSALRTGLNRAVLDVPPGGTTTSTPQRGRAEPSRELMSGLNQRPSAPFPGRTRRSVSSRAG